MSASPAPNQGAEQEKRVAFKFCSECSNILYPKEDTQNSTLMFECRTCRWSTQADTSCIYRNELTNTVGATAGVTQDVAQDPTVGNPSLRTCSTNSTHGHNMMVMDGAVEGSGRPGGDDGDYDDDSYDAHGHDYVPDMCILCGDEIYCDICGQQSYGGANVLIDELGRISDIPVHASQDGNVGAFAITLPQSQPSQSQPSDQQLQLPLQQLHLQGQLQQQTPSPPPSP